MRIFNLKNKLFQKAIAAMVAFVSFFPATCAYHHVGVTYHYSNMREYRMQINAFLLEAVRRRSPLWLCLQLQRGADNVNDALRYAMSCPGEGCDEIIRILLGVGADPEERFSNGSESPFEGATSLMFAVKYGNVQAVKALLNHGVDVNATNIWLETPLMQAAGDVMMLNRDEIVSLLLENKANVNLRCDDHGKTALMLAAGSVHPYTSTYNAVCMLLRAGARVNDETTDGRTALSFAVAANNYEIARCLLMNGADMNVPSTTGGTLLEQAKSNGHPEMVALLEGYLKKSE